jgi:ubiquinone/menaquinone biosynthesis C-methylase UbiE
MPSTVKRLMFGLMYRVGFTPWDGHRLPARLVELVEGDAALPPGRALDVGCGTGDTAIYLAQHGWEATGVDFVEHALERAREKSRRARVEVPFVRADVTRLGSCGLGDGFDLVTDLALFHGLSDEDREAYARELTPLVREGGRLLMIGFDVRDRRGPRGVDRQAVERHFTRGWQLLDTGPAPDVTTSPDDPLNYFDLRRTADE